MTPTALSSSSRRRPGAWSVTVRSSGSARTRRSTSPSPSWRSWSTGDGDIVGYTVCDDVSSRSIEGENPLYLPQAKTYAGGCALGPAIRPVWEIADPYALAIALRIWRGGALAWDGVTTTGLLHRTLDELVRLAVCGPGLPAGRRPVDRDVSRPGRRLRSPGG